MKVIALKLYQRIIKRQIPHAILSWRYFLPKQNYMVHLHRQTFLSAWSGYPRIIWFLIACYSYSVWYLFYSWHQVYRTWKKNHKALLDREDISSWKQLKGLLCLSLLNTTPPNFYYQYHLYRRPEREWLNFIYTHELPHWHTMMSPHISSRSQDLMSHKRTFAIEMIKHGIPAIASQYNLEKGDKLTNEQLFCQQSLFLKPDRGSRKEGCYALHYHPENHSYSLEGSAIDKKLTRKGIKDIIEKQTLTQRYLIQALLENHPLISARCECKQLITIRLITILKANKPRVISAILELPVPGDFEYIMPIIIELDTGILSNMSGQHVRLDKQIEQRVQSLSGFELPLWHQLLRVALTAHLQFTDVHSIGWDLAITPEGIRLIEGNLNWAVASHQLDGIQRLICKKIDN